jgi:hypothetical protein
MRSSIFLSARMKSGGRDASASSLRVKNGMGNSLNWRDFGPSHF